MYASRRAMW
ncbi:hypothetical protein ABKN59_008850 [Abortiporus biennis]